jgi:hypothetical protein
VRSLRPDPGTLRQDAVAAVPGAIASVPDGMASAVLVGVIIAGVLRWGRFTRFVSVSVLTRFLAEVAETILQSTQTAYDDAEEWLGVHAG